MAGLDEVLRTFALQKMQELKEKQGIEDATEDMIIQSTKNCVQEATENKEFKGKPEDETQIYEQTDHTPSQETVGSEYKQMKPSERELDINETETDAKVKEPNQKKADGTSKDSKDKKITIKLFTKTIEPEVLKQDKDDDDEGISSDGSENEDEAETKDGTPWRKVYEEGELSPSSESDEEEGEGGIKSNKEDDKNSDSSGEIKDENTKKSKKHKKHKHKKHKHKEKVKDKETTKDKEKHKDKSKKEKNKDKDRKEHKDKNKKKSKSKDKEDAQDKEDVADVENLQTEKKHKHDKKHKSKHKDKGDEKDEKSKSSSKRKHKSRSRSQSPSAYKSSHKKRRHSSRSRSKSPRDHKHESNSRDRDYYGKRTHESHYSNSDSKHRRQSRSRSPYKEDEFRIDKAKLLEIAKANAYAKMQSGEFPPYMKLTPKSIVTRVDKKEGRSVEELTAVCKEISSKQKDYSDSDDSPVNRPVGSDEENDEPFIRHPFKVREAPLGIVMNIKNAVQKPIQDKEMLRLTFPVSSGSQHRKKEDELGVNPYGDWIAVEKKPKMMDPVAKPTTKIIPIPGITTMTSAEATSAAVGATLAATETSMKPVVAPVVAPPAVAPDTAAATAMPPPLTTNVPTAVAAIPAATPAVIAPVVAMPPAPLTFAGIIAGALPSTSAIAAASAIPAAAAAAEYAAVTAAAAVQKAAEVRAAQLPVPIGVAAVPPVQPKKVEQVFEEVPTQKVDIAAMVSARLKAARRLESNPNDVEALTVMHKAQTQIRNWTMDKQKPGMFTGNTGLRTLRPEQLANSDPRAQAWAKKNMFHNQTPLKGGVGAMLMAKMGWRQGEGLGKNNEGVLEPLALDVKTDRKGLVAEDEQRRKKNQVPKAIFKDLSGKHPVSALMEICNKRKWAPPSFDLVQDKGPAHKKSFIFKVRINNEEYQPSVSCPNKKQAKAQAAAAALQKMGLIPPDSTTV